jgi:GDP-4-dehydro-6-deoxy-D-mannose reductase
MKTLLVTGADGFIGTHVVRRLAATGSCRLVIVARRPPKNATTPGIERVQADLSDPAQVVDLIERWKPDVVIHAAGGRGRTDDEEWANVRMTQSLFDAIAAKAPNAHIVLFGSAAEYGETGETPVSETARCRPATTYGRTKLAITEEALARTRDGMLRATILRPFNVIGPGISATLAAASFLQQVKQGRMQDDAYLITMGARDAVRDFVAVDDLVTAIETLIERDLPGEIVNVCTGEGRTLDWLLTRMAKLGGAKVTFEVDAKHVATGQPSISIGDPSKGQRMLGFTPSADLDATLLAMWNDAIRATDKD